LFQDSLWIWDEAKGRKVLEIPTGTDQTISPLAFSADSRTIAACLNNAIGLWDLATGRQIRTLAPNQGSNYSVAFSPDGRQVATAGTDSTVRLWDATSSQEIRVLRRHTSPVFGQAFSPDGRWLATLGFDGRVGLWNVADGGLIRTFAGVHQVESDRNGNALAFSPDGRQLAAASDDATVKIWDTASGREVLTLRGHTKEVNAVAYLPPGGRRIVSSSEDGTIKLWDSITGAHVFTLRGHTSGVLSIACRVDGRRIASAGIDGTVRLWDADPVTVQLDPAELARRLLQDGRFHARWQGEWNLAAQEFARALELDPGSRWNWYQSAALQLWVGDRKRYRHHCHEMLRRFGTTRQSEAAEQVAKTCLLDPLSFEDIALPRQLAELSYRLDPKSPWVLLAKGLSDYRGGRYEAALATLDRGLDGIRNPYCRISNYLVQSMAYARFGQPKLAREFFHRATRLMPDGFAQEGHDDLGDTWHDWLHCQIVHREAEAIVAATSGELPGDVFARESANGAR
jgi:DNA-binding beta-propeller fold protein YncE